MDEDEELRREIEEQLKNTKYNENDTEYCHTDRDDRSEFQVDFGQKNEVDDSLVIDKEAWEGVLAGGRERENRLKRTENLIIDLKLAKAGLLKLDDDDFDEDNSEKVKQSIQDEEVLLMKQQIAEQLKKSAHIEDAKPEPIFKLPENIPETDKPSATPRSIQKNKSQQTKHDLNNDILNKKMEKAVQDREQMMMEREDQISRHIEEQIHQEYFKRRLVNLPATFPIMAEQPSNSLQFRMTTPKPIIFQINFPVDNIVKNLAQSNKVKFETKDLSKIINKARHSVKILPVNPKSKQQSLPLTIAEEEKPKTYYLNQSNLKIELTSLSRLSLFLKKVPKINKLILQDYQKLVQNIKPEPLQGVYEYLKKKATQDDNENLEPQDMVESETEKSLENFTKSMSQKEKNSRIRMEYKMEKINDLKTISELKNIEFLYLSMNKIKQVDGLETLSKILEINLAQNEVTSMAKITNLPNLRILNLELNQLKKIEGLQNCKSLEQLNLNNNQIEKIENLKDLKNLRKLHLFRNKVVNIQGLENLINLEELDLGRNQIMDLEGLESCIILKKLILYSNQIQTIKNRLTQLFLTELYLNGNKLTDVSNLSYLPSLELLNLENNQIAILANDSLGFLPNLRILKLSNNKIESYAQLHRFLMRSTLIEELQYSDNPFLEEILPPVKEFQNDTLLKTLSWLKEVNNNKLSQRKIVLEKHRKKEYILPYSRLMDDYQFIEKAFNSKFNKFKIALLYQQVLHKCKNLINNSIFANLSALIDQIPGNPFLQNHECSHELASLDFKLKTQLEMLRSFVVKIFHKKRKRKQFFMKNIKKITRLQAFFKGYSVRKVNNAFKIIATRRKKKAFQQLAPFALKIQKVYRGFRIRKKFKGLFKNISFSMDGLEGCDDDIDFFNKEPNMEDYQLHIPDMASVFMKLSQPIAVIPTQKENNPKILKKNLQEIEEQKEPADALDDSRDDAYSVSSAKTNGDPATIRLKEENNKPPVKKQVINEKLNQMIDAWGYKDPEAREAASKIFEAQLRKKEQIANKKKVLTTDEKIQAFRANAAKPLRK